MTARIILHGMAGPFHQGRFDIRDISAAIVAHQTVILFKGVIHEPLGPSRHVGRMAVSTSVFGHRCIP